MKSISNILLTTILVAFFCFLPEVGNAVVQVRDKEQISEQLEADGTFASENNLKRKARQRFSFKEKLILALAQKHIKKSENITNSAVENPSKKVRGGKVQLVALILCLFLGLIGVHRFYLGYTGMGVLYIFTLGLFGIGWIIDLILLIIPNGLPPKGKTGYRN